MPDACQHPEHHAQARIVTVTDEADHEIGPAEVLAGKITGLHLSVVIGADGGGARGPSGGHVASQGQGGAEDSGSQPNPTQGG